MLCGQFIMAMHGLHTSSSQYDNMKRIIVAITGASGVIYGIRALEILKKLDVETHLIVSKAAEMTLAYETDFKVKDLRDMAHEYHPMSDIGANIDRKSTRLNSSHVSESRMPSSA